MRTMDHSRWQANWGYDTEYVQGYLKEVARSGQGKEEGEAEGDG